MNRSFKQSLNGWRNETGRRHADKCTQADGVLQLLMRGDITLFRFVMFRLFNSLSLTLCRCNSRWRIIYWYYVTISYGPLSSFSLHVCPSPARNHPFINNWKSQAMCPWTLFRCWKRHWQAEDYGLEGGNLDARKRDLRLRLGGSFGPAPRMSSWNRALGISLRMIHFRRKSSACAWNSPNFALPTISLTLSAIRGIFSQNVLVRRPNQVDHFSLILPSGVPYA